MSFQISRVFVFGIESHVRQIKFRLGQLNIITGASHRGKSSILNIIDYCLGSTGHPVKAGVIREHSRGYGLLLVKGDQSLFVARPAPEGKNASTTRMHVVVNPGETYAPVFDQLEFNANVDSVRDILSEFCGIDRTIRIPAIGNTPPIPPSIRHSLFFVFQGQNEVANPALLFHSQGDEWRPQVIRAVLPYFLGAVNFEQAAMTIRVRTLKRELASMQRAIAASLHAARSAEGQARALLAEAAQVGLVDDWPEELVTESQAVELLRSITQFPGVPEQPRVQGDRLVSLVEQRRDLRGEYSALNMRLAQLRSAVKENGEFLSEAREQRGRLATLGLFKGSNDDLLDECPVCGSDVTSHNQVVVDMSAELMRLTAEISSVRIDTPRIDSMIAELESQIQLLVERMRANRAEIDELEAANRALSQIAAASARAALVRGRIGYYLETLDRQISTAVVEDRTADLETEILELEGRLSSSGDADLLATFISLISQNLWVKARQLKLEHSNYPVRLDVRGLTVIADTRNGAVPLDEMGSGENWLGYHIAALLALHEWFVEEARPVPGVLVLDQPSQVYFPSDYAGDGTQVLLDDDRAALVRAYQVLRDSVARLSPNFQVIVMEHADLEERWFQDSIIERWREDGDALIPDGWISGEQD
ncbi:DUF3732 domain-containing protein [Micromonospora sp. NPDC048170]|uniref:DUF3732 domain-containing protein n=1 Tax=Micromonospora sp. NPDC048170 TaxID=3154819 RepID=UPI0033F5F7CB